MNTKIFLHIFFMYTAISQTVCFAQQRGKKPEEQQVIPDMKWLNEKDSIKPKYVWENREDYIYHEMYYPDSLKLTAPELYPIMRGPWVFNRAMKWIRQPEGTILAYTDGMDLYLTGKDQVSAWYSDPDNSITINGNKNVFNKNNAKRRRDCAVLPSFQFHLSQHPVLELDVQESSDEWQFVISVKGRSGPPFICSGWQNGPRKMRFDIARVLRNKGFEGNFAEVHLVIGTWAKNAASNSTITYQAKLIAQPAIVGTLPVIRSISNIGTGIPITAKFTGSGQAPAKLFAIVNGQKISLTKSDSLWRGSLKNLQQGTYHVSFETDVPGIASSNILVRITDGEYWKHNKQFNALQKKGVHKPMLNGSFQGTFFFKDVGLASEQLINSQQQWNEWDRAETPGEHMHYWEALTRKELNNRFSYLAQNGWDVVHLHSHYGIWERFDASGNLAPHGIEQFALYVDEAAKNGLSVQVTLSSYPYSINTTAWLDGTTPYMQTIEKGFKNEDWYNPQNEPFRSVYHQYLKDFAIIFKDETAILSYSSSGEGDWRSGFKRFQDTKEVIRSIDTNRIIVSEPIFLHAYLKKFTSEMVEGFTSDLVGSRNYGLGTEFNPDEEMSLALRMQQTAPNSYVAEGAYPSSNLYTKMTYDPGKPDYNTWVGTDEYRYNVRDWIYLSLANRMPLAVTWDEALTEDEHIVANEVSKLINWNQPVEAPPVAVVLTERDFGKARLRLGVYERLFSKLAINYRFIENIRDARKGEWVLNSSKHFDSVKYSKISNLPVSVQATIPFIISNSYSAHYTKAKDRKTLVAYLVNKSNYERKKYYLSGTHHRMPLPVVFELTFENIPENLNYRLYDLDKKAVVVDGKTLKNKKISINNSYADYVLVVFP